MAKKLIVLIIAVFLLIKFVGADPQNKTVIYAEAGNLTQLSVFDSQIGTSYWVGYFGNVSGDIRLQNSNNWSMYSWSGSSTTTGEVYAANATVLDWSTIRCVNLSSTYKSFNCTGENELCLNITKIESNYGMNPGDADGVDETFNSTLSSITVGTTTLSNCVMTSLYTNGSPTSNPDWNETILTINNSNTVIYTSIINPNTYGFNNLTWDFQMIVADSSLDALPTKYYVYTELG